MPSSWHASHLMTKVLTATTGTLFDDDAIAKAVRLLGPDHQFLFLSVYPDTVSTLTTMPGPVTGPVAVDQHTWDQLHTGPSSRQSRQSPGASVIDSGPEIRVEQGD